MRSLVFCFGLLTLIGCSPIWPANVLPEGVELERTLFAESKDGMREGCVAIVGELADRAWARIGDGHAIRREGWQPTPLVLAPNQHLYAKGARGGCNDDDGGPIGDFEGVLARPGAYYKIVNGGEGLVVIVPRAKLAGWFYFG